MNLGALPLPSLPSRVMENGVCRKSCSVVFAAALALAAQAAEVQDIGGFLEQGKVGAGGEGVVASDRIEWRTRSERVDVAEADTNAHFHFGFINRLDESVQIAKVIAPCGCTTVDFRPEPVHPGGVGGISAVLDFGMAVGRLTKHVSVEISNASGSFRQSYELGLETDVPKVFTNFSAMFVWSRAQLAADGPLASQAKTMPLRFEKAGGQQVIAASHSLEGLFQLVVVPTVDGCIVSMCPSPSKEQLEAKKMISAYFDLEVRYPNGNVRPYRVCGVIAGE